MRVLRNFDRQFSEMQLQLKKYGINKKEPNITVSLYSKWLIVLITKTQLNIHHHPLYPLQSRILYKSPTSAKCIEWGIFTIE
jgi:hypothetical protein